MTAKTFAKVRVTNYKKGGISTRLMNKKLLIPGVILVLCLPLFLIAAGVTSYLLPRQYYSRVRIEYKGSEGQLTEAFQAARQSVKNEVTLQPVRNTSLHDIGVYDLNPLQAANLANSIGIALGKTFNRDETSDQQSFRIWEKAEVALAPARPNVGVFMLIATAAGMLFALSGGVLIIVALVTRNSRPQIPLTVAI